ncbi:MAG: hypothetical protein QXO21_05460 [Candidatus Anstonellales archaeon]
MNEKKEEAEEKKLEERVAHLEDLVYQIILKEEIVKANSKIDGVIDKYKDWPDID